MNRIIDLLERLTACILVLVVLALGWMLVVSFQPEWLRLDSVQAEIVAVLGLLTAALVLVTLVSLLHTRRRRR